MRALLALALLGMHGALSGLARTFSPGPAQFAAVACGARHLSPPLQYRTPLGALCPTDPRSASAVFAGMHPGEDFDPVQSLLVSLGSALNLKS